MKTSRVMATGVAALILVLGLSACASSSPHEATPTSGASPTHSTTSPTKTPAPHGGPSSTVPASAVITIKAYGYSGPASVAGGATVTVKNDDGVAHTVTADSTGSFDIVVAADSSATFTAPMKPGSYAYHCIYHSNMHGTLVVR